VTIFFSNSGLTDFLFKYLVIGSAGTGKSCILHQFIENKCKQMWFSLDCFVIDQFPNLFIYVSNR